jgi:alkanesulfonate monooxygenase SsuD/methylene tetrahydromethanopterin reductase-like flavin-dependent oxidoreductase (luciferase family)
MIELGLFSLMGLYDRNTSPAAVVRTTVDMVGMAEDLHFDVAWFAEHLFTNHSICPSALMMVARCAGTTKRIRLGPAVLAMPFHNPLRLVQEVAFTDLLASGRLVLGLGCGYQPYEFDRFGVHPRDKYDLMFEAWDILNQGLTNGHIEYQGRFFKIPPTNLSMSPFGLKMPPVFVVSVHPPVVARIFREGATPFMSYGHRGLSQALKTRGAIESAWVAAGGDAATMPLAVHRYVYVTDDRNEARNAAECVRNLARAYETLICPSLDMEGPFVRLMPFHDEPPLDDFLDSAVIGSAAYCAERLTEDIEVLRPTHMSCFMGFAGIGRGETLASMERFGSDVLPILQPLLRSRGLPDAA